MSTDALTEPIETQEEETSRRVSRWDPELLLIADMIRQLDKLEPDRQRRIVGYLADRYGRCPF